MSDRWLIAGLGNPGKEYEGTRHNIGFHILHALAAETGIPGKQDGKFNALVGTGRWGRTPVVLVQPLTYMNLSGEAVRKLMDYYEIDPDHLLVIYDEAALPFGKLRVRPGGSDAGQKGIKSIIQHLGGDANFPRIRIGIGAPAVPQMSMPDHVLSKFAPDEQKHLPALTEAAIAAARKILEEGVEPAMTAFNGLEIVPQPKPEKPPAPKPDAAKEIDPKAINSTPSESTPDWANPPEPGSAN